MSKTTPTEDDDTELNTSSFAQIFGISETEITETCRERIDVSDFHYRYLSQFERDQVIHGILLAMEREQPISGPQRLVRWEEGWGENLQEFITSGFSEKALIPGYYRRGITPMRLFGDFILPISPEFEVSVLAVLQAWIAETFFTQSKHVYEFGCGPAHNLFAFSQLFPNKCYHGLDWASASQDIIRLLADRKGLQIDGDNFDMFHPSQDYMLEHDSIVLTIGSMEQLGPNYIPFFNYILGQGAAHYVHIEPIKELHDPESLIDHLAIRFMEQRGYLDGYLDHLQKLDDKGVVEITHRKSLIGSTNYTGWNLIAWKRC